MLVLKAHHALEKHVLTKWQLSWKDQLAQFYGNWLHEGQYLDPVMRDMEAFLRNSQQNVTGEVHIQLYPYRFQVYGNCISLRSYVIEVWQVWRDESRLDG